jgi:5-deoxy-glucuronate isomerase
MSSTPALESIANGTCIVRNTASRPGRSWSVTPEGTAARHLHYGRIVLSATDAPIEFNTAGLETGLIALKGSADVEVGGAIYAMTPYDALYVPRESRVRVRPGAAGCDFAEVAAPVERTHPVQFIPFACRENRQRLHFAVGGPHRSAN